MAIFDHYQDQYDQVISEPHKAKLSHELLAGAASFEAARMYEKHREQNGNPANHALATELFAGFAGAAVDRLIETKGADALSHHRENARKHARQQVEETFTENVYNEYN